MSTKQKSGKDKASKQSKQQKQGITQEDIDLARSEESPMNFIENYLKDTPKKVKIIDAFSAYLFCLWVIQIVYRYLVGDFPKNAYLAGVYATGGLMIINICLRMQVNPKTRYIKNQSFSTTFWEYFFSVTIFFVAIFNYLG